jgi:hypothetical protein
MESSANQHVVKAIVNLAQGNGLSGQSRRGWLRFRAVVAFPLAAASLRARAM